MKGSEKSTNILQKKKKKGADSGKGLKSQSSVTQ